MKQLRKHWVIIMATLAFITVHAQSSSNAEEPALPFQLWETPRDVPGVTFVDSEGRQVYLSAFRGKALLLNVWATWCPPCRKEMPALDRLENTLGGSKFEVIALSVDSVGLRDVKPFFESLGLNS